MLGSDTPGQHASTVCSVLPHKGRWVGSLEIFKAMPRELIKEYWRGASSTFYLLV